MLEDIGEQDHFLGMIDKLHVMNLSIEGASILASMADAIRAALEKGQLLEQIIINQRTTALQNSNPEVTLRKKKKKKQKNSISTEDADVIQSVVTSDVEEQNLQLDISSKSSIQKTNPFERKSDPRPGKNINSLPTVKENNSTDKTAPSTINVIKVVSPSFLNSTLNPTLIQNKLTNESVPLPIQHTLNKSRNYPSDILIPYQFQYVHQTEGGRISQNSCTYPLPEKSLPPSEPMLFESNNPENQSRQMITNMVGQQYHLNSSISKVPSSHHESTQSEDEQPVMPFPIIIKTEYKHPPPNQSMSFDLSLNTTDSSGPAEVTSSGNGLEISQDYQVDSGSVNNLEAPKQQYKVFIEAGKEATEDEVHAVFEDLDIVYSRIIHKPNYSFGFIEFSTEEHMKAALALTKKFSIGGKLMYVRPWHEQRNKRKRQPSVNEFSSNRQECLDHSAPYKKIKQNKRYDLNTRTESYAFPRDEFRYQRGRSFQKNRRKPLYHPQPKSSNKSRRADFLRKNNARNQ